MKNSKLLVIKIGSNVITKEDGTPDLDRLAHLVGQIKKLNTQGKRVLIISSGAVAFGRKAIPLQNKLNPVLRKQVWAATGQIPLIHEYQKLFARHQLFCAQILVTKEDFRDRKHYLNMKNCLEALLDEGIIPIINENDTVTITELMFTDNDELASLTAGMINADSLILLSNVDGVYDGNPAEADSNLIPVFHKEDRISRNQIASTQSSFGRGGMLTKYTMAKKTAGLGIEVIIANGKRDEILSNIAQEKGPYTLFEPQGRKAGIKKWLAHGQDYFVGSITINSGAIQSLRADVIRSLLPIGVTRVQGDFVKGDILQIIDEKLNPIGLGRAEYNSSLAKLRLGKKNQKPIIHYNYLYLFDHE